MKHVEMAVSRDANGRVLASHSHEWDEPDATARQHADALQVLTAERDMLRQKLDLMTRVAERSEQSLESLLQALERSVESESAGIGAITSAFAELPATLAARDEQVALAARNQVIAEIGALRSEEEKEGSR